MANPMILSPEPNLQAVLARSLIDCLGSEAAIDVCRRNCWDGVLSALLRLRNGSPKTAANGRASAH